MNWTKDKPKTLTKDRDETEPCWFLTANEYGKDVELYEIDAVFSEDDDTWYWGWLNSNGDEIDCLTQLKADWYCVLEEPK